MKNFIATLAVFSLTTFVAAAQSFVSPIGFTSTEANKQKVIRFIEAQVNADYTKIGMADPSTLRMMEEENLNAFKQLLEAKNHVLLREVIKTYCDIGMCNYSTILMMYEEQVKASQKKLGW